MRKDPPSRDGWFGLEKIQPAPLRLVTGPKITPSQPEPFPFWLSAVIATASLGLGAVGGWFWLIPALAVEEVATAPPVQVRHAERWEEEIKPLPRVARMESARPPAPRARIPLPMPAVQPENLAMTDWERPIEEPYDLPEVSEEADLPFPAAKEEPKVAETPPKPKKTTRRPESSPRRAPQIVAKGKSSPAQILRRYNPPYPSSARRAGTEGRVVLSVQVRSDGRVGSVHVASSSGSAILDSAAVSAVKRWSFAPEMKDGRKVTTTVNVPFRFALQ